jgi:pyruvate/2-oxoacid:ferredoxin oxidoreductase beta subunit
MSRQGYRADCPGCGRTVIISGLMASCGRCDIVTGRNDAIETWDGVAEL